MPQVIIRHPDGREYEIDSADFRRGKHVYETVGGRLDEGQTFAEAGFKIVALADGSEYTGPLNDPPAERAKADKD